VLHGCRHISKYWPGIGETRKVYTQSDSQRVARGRSLKSTIALLKSELVLRVTEVKKGKSSPYSITERRVLELIPVLGSQPAGDVSHKPGGRLPLLSTRPAVTLTTLKRAATNFAAL